MSDASTFIREMNDVGLRIHQSYIGDVGAVVWDSALFTCNMLHKRVQHNLNTFNNMNIIELGAGTGVCSILLASYG
jgi:phospholipid N-methyltransferase